VHPAGTSSCQRADKAGLTAPGGGHAEPVDRDYDLIVIGGGAAGLAAAQAGAAARARTLLVAEGEIGGECTFTGCVPSKTLIEAAARGAAFTEATAEVRRAVATIAATETPAVLSRRGIEVLRGRAAFRSPREITVDGSVLRARGFVVATGSRPAVPPVSGLAGVPYLTNENVFDLTCLPASLAILGAGAVGCELAQAFARLGSQVTLIEAAPRLLPAAEPAVAEVLSQVFAAEGITVRTGSAVETISSIPNGSGCLLRLHDSAEVAAAKLLVAAGRTPNTPDLGLASAGIRLDGRGALVVDRTLATTARGVYAAGDVTGQIMLVSGATHEGHVAAVNAVTNGETRKVAHAWVPTGSFTDPEYGAIGMREQECRDAGIDYETAVIWCEDLTRAIIDDRTAGFCKLIADRGTHKFLGAHIVGERAVETVQMMATIMAGGLTVEQVADLELAFPTYSAIILMAARDLKYKLDPEYASLHQSGMVGSPASKALS